MKNYEVKVTASWWVNVSAKDETEAEKLAWDTFLDDGMYDGVDEIVVHESDEQDEDDDEE